MTVSHRSLNDCSEMPTLQPVRAVTDLLDDVGEQGHVDPRDPHLTKTQEEIDATPMPTHDEWSAAAGQMAAMTVVPWYTRLGRRIAFRWNTWRRVREIRWRIAMQERLELPQMEDYAHDRISDLTNVVLGLRRDLGATNAQLAKADAAGTERLELTEHNLAEFIRQFQQFARGVEAHAKVINGMLQNPMIAKTVRTYQAQQKAKEEREAKRAAEKAALEAGHSIGKQETQLEAVRELVGIEPTLDHDAVAAELEGEAVTLVDVNADRPTLQLHRGGMPDASEPGDHPQAD